MNPKTGWHVIKSVILILGRLLVFIADGKLGWRRSSLKLFYFL